MYHLDLRGLINPFNLLKASKAFKGLKTGETIEIIGSNPETAIDLLKVLPAASCEIISSETIEQGYAGFRILLKKKSDKRY
jgi:TusA-related sulfurtransferase